MLQRRREAEIARLYRFQSSVNTFQQHPPLRVNAAEKSFDDIAVTLDLRGRVEAAGEVQPGGADFGKFSPRAQASSQKPIESDKRGEQRVAIRVFRAPMLCRLAAG